MFRTLRFAAFAISLAGLAATTTVSAQETEPSEADAFAFGPEVVPIEVLFLTKSSTFVHSSIRRRNGELGHAEKVMIELGKQSGFTVTATKDAGLINADDLSDYDVVIFYTTGDLTQPGTGKGMMGGDGNPPMGAEGVDALLAWIEDGGGFLGYHCASDTFHGEPDSVTPYIEMLGGEFLMHGKQFTSSVRVVDPDHPTMRRFPDGWTHKEEWYLFKNLNREKIHVLAMLETAPERGNQPMYDIDPYPIAWCRAIGGGRVYYNAIGHREDIWDEEHFQNSVVDAVRWADGIHAADAEPNFAEVVPE